MKPFTFGNCPSYVEKCRDDGDMHAAVYVPPGGLVIMPDERIASQILTWWVRYPKDGAGRVVVVVCLREPTGDSRWWYGTASGYGYDKVSAAADLRDVFTTPDGQRWTLKDHGGPRVEGDVACFPLRNVDGARFPNGGRWVTL